MELFALLTRVQAGMDAIEPLPSKPVWMRLNVPRSEMRACDELANVGHPTNREEPTVKTPRQVGELPVKLAAFVQQFVYRPDRGQDSPRPLQSAPRSE
jgi:hypothetical protein